MNDNLINLVIAIAGAGKENPSPPNLESIEPFRQYFQSDGLLDRSRLDKQDGQSTPRELLLRFLVLNAVIDQGPDIIGVRQLLAQVTNKLYQRSIRFIHEPQLFFDELGAAVEDILETHESIKRVRASTWAKENHSKASRYNLFMDNSKQVLNYAVFRWGVPLALPLLLRGDLPKDQDSRVVLLDYLESWKSAEEMSQELKSNERYGLGKAIGDKACHLFAKWMVSTFKLTRRDDPGWDAFSFEVPYDSNAGRVLWRTGYLLRWATEKEYKGKEVVQPGRGKGGLNYIRVTNIRGMKASKPLSSEIRELYVAIALHHLKSHVRPPKKFEIQRIQHAYLMSEYEHIGLGVADFDEGLIHIGTSYCFNHSNPLCVDCPINHLCEGHQSNPSLIDSYRT